MNSSLRLAGLCVAATLFPALMATSAHATNYAFSQGGYTGGGTITGAFTGHDLDLNGVIDSFAGEVTAFSLSFSGDSIVPAFTHGMTEFFGLIYFVGSSQIGDDNTFLGTEGMASNWVGTSGFDFASGLGPTGTFGGRVVDVATGARSSTPELIAVVPEPGTYALFAMGVATLVGRWKTRRS